MSGDAHGRIKARRAPGKLLRDRVVFLATALLFAGLTFGAFADESASKKTNKRSDPSTWRLKPAGIGPLRLGMSARNARRVVPSLRVQRHRFCDSWVVPGLEGVAMSAAHNRGGLSSISISGYSSESPRGHGIRGIEINDSIRKARRLLGKRLKFVKRFGSLRKSFYRVYPKRHRRTALEFTVNTGTSLIEYEQAGFRGEFYYTDGVELCG